MFLSLLRKEICRWQKGKWSARQQGALTLGLQTKRAPWFIATVPLFACTLFEHHATRNGQRVWERQSQRVAILDGDEHRIRFLAVLVLIEL